MTAATETQLGEIQLAGDLAGDGGAQVGTNPQLTHISGLTPGQYDVADITVDAKGRITAIADASAASIAGLIPNATTSTVGTVSVGDNLYITGCELYVKDASETEAGVVQIGTGIDVDVDGVISTTCTFPIATTTTLGTVIVPTSGNLVVDGSGNLSVPLATESSIGVMQVGTGLDVSAGVVSVDVSELSLPDATESSKGVMQVGTGLDVSAGVVSVDVSELSLPDATTSTKGVVQIGDNIDVTTGIISVPAATNSTKGVVQIGDGLDVAAGVLSLGIASDTVLGGIKVGSGLSIDGAGILSTALVDATYSTKGVVQIQSGTGLGISSGVLAGVDATTSNYGVVQIGDNIDVTTGIISVPAATNSTKGVVQSADTSHITISSGSIDVGSDVALKDTANTFTKAQNVSLYNVGNVSGATSVDLSLGNSFTMTLTGDTTLSFTNAVSGGVYTFIIIQDGTGGHTLSFGSAFKFRGGMSPSHTGTGGSIDDCSFVVSGTTAYAHYNKDFS